MSDTVITVRVQADSEAALDLASDAIARALGYSGRHDPLFLATTHAGGSAEESDDLAWLDDWAQRRERETFERDRAFDRAMASLDAVKAGGDR
jgi:hypothetical protein